MKSSRIDMDTVLQLGPRQRIEPFAETARQTGFDAVIVENDFRDALPNLSPEIGQSGTAPVVDRLPTDGLEWLEQFRDVHEA